MGIEIPTPDATVKRKKKKEPVVDEEIKNPLFAAMPNEEKKVEEVPPPVEEEEEEEEVKVVEQPKKKLSKSDLKPTVKIKAVFEPEEKTPRRKRKEPVVVDEPAEISFDDIPQIPIEPPKEKVSDHFPDKEKPSPVEESIVIVPTTIAEVELVPDEKTKVSDHFIEKDKKPKEEEKIVIIPKVITKKPVDEQQIPQKVEEKPETVDEEEQNKRNKISDHYAEKDKKPKGEEEKIVIVPYDMDKDIPEVEVEVKKKKKISRENLKSAV